MGAGVIDSDYESEELHNLEKSSSDDELGIIVMITLRMN